MTTGEWLFGQSNAPEGSDMLTVVAEIEGTYPVLTPIESFETNMQNLNIEANLDILLISTNINLQELTVDVTEDKYTANIIMESYDGN